MIIDIKDTLEIEGNDFIVFDSFIENITEETDNVYYENGSVVLETNEDGKEFEAEFDMDISGPEDEEVSVCLFVSDIQVTAAERTVTSTEEEEFQHVNISSTTAMPARTITHLAIKNLNDSSIKVKNIYYEII